jgi:hypothetical protein
VALVGVELERADLLRAEVAVLVTALREEGHHVAKVAVLGGAHEARPARDAAQARRAEGSLEGLVDLVRQPPVVAIAEGAADVERIVGRAFGLARFRWFAYRYELDKVDACERIAVDIHPATEAEPTFADEIEDLLRTLPPTAKSKAPKPKPPGNADDLVSALADVTEMLAARSRAQAKKPPVRKSHPMKRAIKQKR